MERVKFDKNELNVIGEWESMFPGFPPTRKYNTPVTPRENYLATLRGEMPLWIPSMSDGVTLVPKIVPDNIARGFVFDADPLPPGEEGGKDMFGLEWVYVPVAQGSMVKPGNPTMEDANDWEKLVKFPNLDDYDWEGSSKSNAKFCEGGDRLVSVWMMTGLFERLISFMDFEGAAIALIDEEQKDAVKAFFDKLCDMYDGYIERFQKYYHADVFYFHDDWGSQRAPFFSLEVCREMLVPYLKRVADSCHKRGMILEHHSCGKIEQLIPAMIEAGVDTWSGQPMNDKDMLLEKYGDKLVIGVDPDIEFTPQTTPEEAVASAKRFVAKYGPNFAKRPTLAFAMFAPPQFALTVYEESRKLFNP